MVGFNSIDIARVVITGATSSLGCALIDECIESNIKVLALVNPGSKNISNITVSDSVSIVECSLDKMSEFVIDDKFDDKCKYDAFFHLAWAATAGAEMRNQLQPQVMNIEYALDAVNLAEKLGCYVFVGAGSQAEYGRTNEVLTEETSTKPESAYGMAKLCAGQMTRLACQQKGIKHIWPRILSAYGPKCQPQSVINYTLTELLNGRRPSLSKGEQIWDFIYTGDVARALLLLADKGHDGEVYVIGSGKAEPLRNYLQKAKNIVNPKLELGLGDKPYSANCVMHLACDISKLTKDIGFEPKVNFETGIRKTIDWIKNDSR